MCFDFVHNFCQKQFDCGIYLFPAYQHNGMNNMTTDLHSLRRATRQCKACKHQLHPQINPLKTERNQCVPRCKHSPLRL
jgi:hypothetical protein